MGAVLLGVVEGKPLLQVGAGSVQLAEPEQGASQRRVGFQEEGRVLHTLG